MATGGALFVSSLIWCRPLPSELVNTSAEISFEDELLQRVRRCCCCVDSGWPWKTHGTENTSTHSTHEKQLYFRNVTGSDWAFFHFSAFTPSGRFEEKAKMKLTHKVAFDPRFWAASKAEIDPVMSGVVLFPKVWFFGFIIPYFRKIQNNTNAP